MPLRRSRQEAVAVLMILVVVGLVLSGMFYLVALRLRGVAPYDPSLAKCRPEREGRRAGIPFPFRPGVADAAESGLADQGTDNVRPYSPGRSLRACLVARDATLLGGEMTVELRVINVSYPGEIIVDLAMSEGLTLVGGQAAQCAALERNAPQLFTFRVRLEREGEHSISARVQQLADIPDRGAGAALQLTVSSDHTAVREGLGWEFGPPPNVPPAPRMWGHLDAQVDTPRKGEVFVEWTVLPIHDMPDALVTFDLPSGLAQVAGEREEPTSLEAGMVRTFGVVVTPERPGLYELRAAVVVHPHTNIAIRIVQPLMLDVSVDSVRAYHPSFTRGLKRDETWAQAPVLLEEPSIRRNLDLGSPERIAAEWVVRGQVRTRLGVTVIAPPQLGRVEPFTHSDGPGVEPHGWASTGHQGFEIGPRLSSPLRISLPLPPPGGYEVLADLTYLDGPFAGKTLRLRRYVVAHMNTFSLHERYPPPCLRPNEIPPLTPTRRAR
jgi:hypothetical protein